MSAIPNLPAKVVPAQLDFFAIYNPSLGTTDETFANQIVYYSSRESRERSRRRKDVPVDPATLREETNDQLRKVGLAQGMVEFGRSFSDGRSVDTVETERSRIVLHELEAGWWILASINLTVLPPIPKAPPAKGQVAEEEKPEYSTREVKPAILLLGDILRAHSTFLLHHASSMSALFVRTRRSKFIGILGRYWDMFLSSWTILMHGNPARNLYGGIKVAASGELGIGVGEEDRGSGEREVLEGFIGRIDGLVDVIVSKFGEADTKGGKDEPKQPQPVLPWLGSGTEPAAEDGAVFLGTGALSRKSIRDVSHWVEDVHRWGAYAYGVMDNPTSNRRSTKSKKNGPAVAPLSPRPVVLSPTQREASSPTGPSRENSQNSVISQNSDDTKSKADSGRRRPSFRRNPASYTSTDSEAHKSQSKLVQYLKLGYGTHWSLGHSNQHTKAQSTSPKQASTPKADASKKQPNLDGSNDSKTGHEGHFLVGLLGDIEEHKSSPMIDGPVSSEDEEDVDGDNNRVLLRTLTVELEREQDARAETEISIDLGSANEDARSTQQANSQRTGTSNASFESQDRNKTKKLRVVVYVKKPFIFVLLFELRTEVLALARFYRSIHGQLSPLVGPLIRSTTFKPLKPDMPPPHDTTPIYDLIWDPKMLTVVSNIPNIPDPHQLQNSSTPPVWSRLEALNTHVQVIYTYIAATSSSNELEKTCKTSRGWWIVWTRVPSPDPPVTPLKSGDLKVPGVITEEGTDSPAPLRPGRGTPSGSNTTTGTSLVSGPAHPFLEAKCKDLVPQDKEIFLIRRASDYVASKSSSRFPGGAASGAAESWTSGPGKLVQGIGVDTKWYIESLLNLSR